MKDRFNQSQVADKYTDKVKVQLGMNIKGRRIAQGLTQEVMAEVVGISTNFLGDIERGIKYPSFKTLLKISLILTCTLDELTGATYCQGIGVHTVAATLESLELTREHDIKFFVSMARTVHEYIQSR